MLTKKSHFLYFVQFPNLSIPEKMILQKNLRPLGYTVEKLNDKVVSSYGTIGFNTNSVFCIYSPESGQKDIQYSCLLKAIQYIKTNYLHSCFLGIKHGNQFSSFDSLPFLLTDSLLSDTYMYQALHSISIASDFIESILSLLPSYIAILQLIENKQ